VNLEHYDDFLGLLGRDFSRERLVLFCGASGSGKSSAIRFLLERHSHFGGGDVTVMDEVHAGNLHRLAARAAAGGRLLAATHLPLGWMSALPRVAVFRTDRDRAKIARYLRARGVSASPEAVEAYVRRFGATYTDVDIILERYPAPRFDVALARFERFCSLRLG